MVAGVTIVVADIGGGGDGVSCIVVNACCCDVAKYRWCSENAYKGGNAYHDVYRSFPCASLRTIAGFLCTVVPSPWS